MMSSNFTDFVSLRIEHSQQTKHFLVDSQADITILKYASIPMNAKLNKTDIITIRGITNEKQFSLGSTTIGFIIENVIIEQKVHIVSNDFSMPTDGIIGKDFLRRNNCIITYENQTLTIKPTINKNGIAVQIPLKVKLRQNMFIPPLCETIKVFKIDSNSFPCVVPPQEIQKGIFIPTTIVHDRLAHIRILNTRENYSEIDLQTPKVVTEPLSEYDIIMKSNKSSVKSRERDEKLIEILKQSTPKHAWQRLIPLCTEFSDIFHIENDKASVNNFYEQKLTLKDNEPVFTRPYRLPHSQNQEVERQVNELIKNQLIEPTISNYNSPLILVPKKSTNGSKKFRMCVDYKRLNNKIVNDRFPLPRIEDIFDNLGRSRFFSVMDLQSGYHQVPLHTDSRNITAFSTRRGMYQWKVLPFGLSIAPSSFSRMMAVAFANLSPEKCFSYMDDLIVIGFNEQNHIGNLKRVFQICRQYNLKLNPIKCQFFRSEVVFLGHVCTESGLRPDPAKLVAIAKYPRPTDKDAVRRFVAFMNYYRRFIANFAELTKPLTNLTRKRIEFNWSPECEKSFQTLKEKLLTPPILKYPNYEKEFNLIVDASDFACGAVLTQEYDNMDMPIAYVSKCFNKGEKNKPPIEKELLAVHFAITQFRPYIMANIS